MEWLTIVFAQAKLESIGIHDTMLGPSYGPGILPITIPGIHRRLCLRIDVLCNPVFTNIDTEGSMRTQNDKRTSDGPRWEINGS